MRCTFSLAVVVVLCCSVSPCMAQRGRPSPERFFRFLDQDGDGTIRGSEWDRVPQMRGMLEEMEIDPERGVQLEQFEDMSGEMMQRMRERGGFGGRSRGDEGRGRGSFGRGSGDEGVRDSGRDYGRGSRSRFGRSSSDSESDQDGSERRRFGRGRRGGGDSGDQKADESPRDNRRTARQSRNDRNGNNAPKNASENKRPRVTLDLPAEYAAHDQNRDGQVGLYEWPQSDFAAFARLDHNGDGFLTPRELQHSDRAASNTSVASTVTLPPKSRTVMATPVSQSSSTGSGSKYQEAARFAFRALDRDKDSVVGVDEWKRSRSTRPLFEKGGVDISQPMSREDFIANYIRLRSQ